jgi:hypothetical protein
MRAVGVESRNLIAYFDEQDFSSFNAFNFNLDFVEVIEF